MGIEDLDDLDLIYETYRPRGVGGVSPVQTYPAVRIIHKPTGLEAICQEHKNQQSNKVQALDELRELVHQRATQRCAKCHEWRPDDDYLCERCRSLQ